MTTEHDVIAGQVHVVRYPFVRVTVELWPDDPEATQPKATRSWRPGVEVETDQYGGSESAADAMGEMLLTVIDKHKPGRFPTRVFYTRQWKDPDGHTFGKRGLRITTLDAFRRLIRGYAHEFWLDGERTSEVLARSQ